jgi:DNA modification methylase
MPGFNERWDAMERVEQCSGMRNKRSVWSVATQPFSEAHFATFPPELIEPCIKAGCPAGGTLCWTRSAAPAPLAWSLIALAATPS